jgi:hypothetical protein
VSRSEQHGSVTDRHAQATPPLGPPDACAAEIRRMRDGFHITDVIISGMANGPTTDVVDGNLRRFVEEVVPLLR